jgi:hypothetical protein
VISSQHSSTSDEVNKMCKSTPYIIRLLNMHEALQTLCQIQEHTTERQLEYNVHGKGKELDEILHDSTNTIKINPAVLKL